MVSRAPYNYHMIFPNSLFLVFVHALVPDGTAYKHFDNFLNNLQSYGPYFKKNNLKTQFFMYCVMYAQLSVVLFEVMFMTFGLV